MKINLTLLLFSFFLMISCTYDLGLEEINHDDKNSYLDGLQVENLSKKSPTKVFLASGSITIDGMENEWLEVPKRKMRKEIDLNLPIENKKDLSGYYKMLWDQEYLYVFASIVDEDIDVSGAQLFEKDGLEIYIDGDNSKNAAAPGFPTTFPPPAYDENDDFIRFIPNIPFPLSAWGIIDASNFEFQFNMTEDGYNIEIAIPFADLPDFPAKAGHQFGLEFQLNDNDKGVRQNFLKWFSGLDNSFYDPSTFGTAILFKAEAG